MSYVDAILDRKNDLIRVAERDADGVRILRDIQAHYVFYHENANGNHRSIFGHPAKKVTANSKQKFHGLLNRHIENGEKIFESDINPVFRCLADHYAGKEAPVLNIGFFDIEADWDAAKGFAPPTDPFNAITAITLYTSKNDVLLTLVIKPPTITYGEAQDIVDELNDENVKLVEDGKSCFPGDYKNRKVILFQDEHDMLNGFLDAIEDVDVLTSWNGSYYDIPYTINRVARVLGHSEIKRFCLWDQSPTEREYKNKFGKTVFTYDLVGRVHLDYLELYAKHNPQQRLSYALNSIGQLVVGESKVQYEGSLDDLYKKEFKKFIEYNLQDVLLMVKIDAKLKYIELHNQVAHSNTVILKTTMGSVALVEQAIINEMHAMGFVVPNRRSKDDIDSVEDIEDIDDDDEDEHGAEHWQKIVSDDRSPVVGAYVAQPKPGLHDMIGCVDINSLYPSAIRACNMSPETLIGQVRLTETMQLIRQRLLKLKKTERASAWDGLFSTLEVSHMHDQNDTMVTVDFFDMSTDTTTMKNMTGKQLHAHVFDMKNHSCITANGTIFRTDVQGIIPQLLGKWYSERKEMQTKQKEWADKKEVATTPEAKKEAGYWVDFWNQRQQARKILLNSLYGALLNEALRFYDERLGQSVTLTGRTIVRHMNATINELIAGIYDYKGNAIVYSDTDSSYFSGDTYVKLGEETGMAFEAIKAIMASKDDTIDFYDIIAEETNATFPEFMQRTFNTSLERGAIIRAGRELVAVRGLFIKKKKYAVLKYEEEGKRLDKDGPGKLKVMGLDLKRSDTPKYMQEFLEKLLMDVLTGKDKSVMYDDIKAFRKLFKTRPGWEKGSPKKVADITKHTKSKVDVTLGGNSQAVKRDTKKITVPGHVTASINWNRLRDMNNDKYAEAIGDSSRIIVCKLMKNTYGMTSVAYPTDEPHLPQWFKGLPFDHAAMEETIIDNKILNLVGVLNWNLTDTKEKAADDLFTFG